MTKNIVPPTTNVSYISLDGIVAEQSEQRQAGKTL